jgi:drug/metabolite transporter (DMT)-like permease
MSEQITASARGGASVSPGIAALFAVYTVLAVSGTVLLKANASEAIEQVRAGVIVSGPALLVAVGGILHVASFGAWLGLLSLTPATRAYPVAVGLTMIGIALSGALILGERLSPIQMVGMVLIVAGITFVAATSTQP